MTIGWGLWRKSQKRAFNNINQWTLVNTRIDTNIRCTYLLSVCFWVILVCFCFVCICLVKLYVFCIIQLIMTMMLEMRWKDGERKAKKILFIETIFMHRSKKQTWHVHPKRNQIDGKKTKRSHSFVWKHEQKEIFVTCLGFILAELN